MIAREHLHRLIAGGADPGANIISAFVQAAAELVVQELVEAEQADFVSGRGHYQRRGEAQAGYRS